MNNPLISVIVPCYNQAQYLDECLQSVLDQTYSNWECIIVNDGSPDNTEEVAKKWLAKDSRFRYFYKENGGLSSARNFGIKKAEGEWILPLDSDDKIGDCYLEKAQIHFHEDFKIIYCKAHFFGSTLTPWLLRDYSYQDILFGNHIFCAAFFKKIDWENASGYDENLKYGREDWDFWLSILNEGSKVSKLDYVGFYYRRKENSMDVQLNENEQLLIDAENYIFKKHLHKYLFFNKNAIFNSRYYFNLEKENNKMKLYLEKNSFVIRVLTKLHILK